MGENKKQVVPFCRKLLDIPAHSGSLQVRKPALWGAKTSLKQQQWCLLQTMLPQTSESRSPYLQTTTTIEKHCSQSFKGKNLSSKHWNDRRPVFQKYKITLQKQEKFKWLLIALTFKCGMFLPHAVKLHWSVWDDPLHRHTFPLRSSGSDGNIQ